MARLAPMLQAGLFAFTGLSMIRLLFSQGERLSALCTLLVSRGFLRHFIKVAAWGSKQSKLLRWWCLALLGLA